MRNARRELLGSFAQNLRRDPMKSALRRDDVWTAEPVMFWDDNQIEMLWSNHRVLQLHGVRPAAR